MKLSMLALGAALSLNLAAGAAFAQNSKTDTKKPADSKPMAQDDPAAMMEQYAELAKPGPEHKRLDAFVGNWNVKSTFWMEPGSEPNESTGKSRIEWIMDGHYQRQTFTGEFMGNTFKGEALSGYNKVTGEYFGTWIDSMSTGMGLSYGTASADGKTFTYKGTFDDPMTGEKCNTREVITVVGKDEFKMTAYMVMPEGSEYKHMELHYTRAK